ncbi:MAG: alpha/beta hydrolase [Microbacterium sp.]|nr:alpha/beta hydrolase [Microbacterium sp.]
MPGVWTSDVLGAPFEQQTLPLPAGTDGEIVATLVRSIPGALSALTGPLRDVDVLSVHGWSDYFFHREVARFWNALGARFYALDLRRYGRSLREGNTPGYIASLDEYDADIDAALAAIGSGRRRLVLQGHSTGGLTLALWTARHPGRVDRLVLNAPWLEFQTGAFARQAIAPVVGARARFDPFGSHPQVDLGFYTRALTELGTAPRGDMPAAWRPARGFATHPGWLNAVLEGHRRVDGGLDIACPVLVLLSRRTVNPFVWSPEMTAADAVLVVDEIARAATRLGPHVTIARIDGAVHDVFLSAPDARQAAYRSVDAWMRSRVPGALFV